MVMFLRDRSIIKNMSNSSDYEKYLKKMNGGSDSSKKDGNTYDSFMEGMNSNKVKKAGKEKKTKEISKFKRTSDSKKSAEMTVLDKISAVLNGENRFIVIGVGIISIIAVGLLINSISIHHLGGKGFVSSGGGSILSTGTVDTHAVSEGSNVEFMAGDGTEYKLSYDSSLKKLVLYYTPDSNDEHISVEQIVYKQAVAKAQTLAEIDAVSKGVSYKAVLETSGWELGVPIKITRYVLSGTESSDTFMVRVVPSENVNTIVVNRQVV